MFKQTVANHGTIEDLHQVLMQFDTDVYQDLGNDATPILQASALLYSANYALINNLPFLFSLSNYNAEKMLADNNEVRGKLESVICGIGFAQYGAWIGYALALGGISAGTTALIGFAIGVVGAVVCA